MIARVEALSYRCLRYVRQHLGPFQVLIGPNASGKSTFLDVIAFLADVVREKEGLAAAIASRAPDLRDLCWMRRNDVFELAIESAIPEALRALGYPENEIAEIEAYAVGHGSLGQAPGINVSTLKAKGFTDEAIKKAEAALPTAFDIKFAFNKWTFGEDFLRDVLKLELEAIAARRGILELLLHATVYRARLREPGALEAARSLAAQIDSPAVADILAPSPSDVPLR